MSGKLFNMIMSKGHFKATVTRGTQGNEIAKQIGVVLELVKPSTVNMVYIEGAPARAMTYPAIFTNFITLKYFDPNGCPVPAMCKFFAASPVGAIISGHVLNGAFSRAVFPSFIYRTWKGCKPFATIYTNIFRVLFSSNRLTFTRTILNSGTRDRFLADNTREGFYSFLLPSRVAVPRAKYIFNLSFGPVLRTRKPATALIALMGVCFDHS